MHSTADRLPAFEFRYEFDWREHDLRAGAERHGTLSRSLAVQRHVSDARVTRAQVRGRSRVLNLVLRVLAVMGPLRRRELEGTRLSGP